jgi:hypothetical protein
MGAGFAALSCDSAVRSRRWFFEVSAFVLITTLVLIDPANYAIPATMPGMREDSVATTFRQKRLERFTRLLKPSGITKIIDLGGTVSYWKSLGCLYNDPRVHITILNMFADREYDDGNLTMRRGDACDVAFPDHHFDVVHSNSVIEHVGSTASMARMAQEVVRLAPSYFVQTPNYWFPIEPHFKSPFVHWLPEDVRIRVLRILRKVPSDRERQLKAVRGTVLLSRRQMQDLFPQAEIWEERFFGLTKSLVAIAEPDASRD